MGIMQDIALAVRRWVRDLNDLSDSQILLHPRFNDRSAGEIPGPRPALPYVVIDVLTFNQHVGVDETRSDNRHKLYRTATVRITGYGDEATDWVSIASGYTGDLEDPFDIYPITSAQVMSAQVDDGWEQQCYQDYRVDYGIRRQEGDVTAGEPLEDVDITYNINDDAPFIDNVELP